MICDVIGSDEKDHNSELSQNAQQTNHSEEAAINQPMLIENQQAIGFNSMSLFAYPNHEDSPTSFESTSLR